MCAHFFVVRSKSPEKEVARAMIKYTSNTNFYAIGKWQYSKCKCSVSENTKCRLHSPCGWLQPSHSAFAYAMHTFQFYNFYGFSIEIFLFYLSYIGILALSVWQCTLFCFSLSLPDSWPDRIEIHLTHGTLNNIPNIIAV